MTNTSAGSESDHPESTHAHPSGQRGNPVRWRRLAALGTALLLAVSVSACAAGGAAQPADGDDASDGKQVRSQIKLAIGEITPVWDTFKEVAQEEHGIDVELVSFQDWNLPNQALVHGEVDVNAFQHILFLSQFNAANDETLRPVGVTSLGTMGIYSEGVDSLEDIPKNSQLLLPNDPTNQGRALLLLDGQGLITLDPEVGEFGSIENVIENPHGFEFVPLVAQQIATSLRDAGAGVTYQSQAVKAGIPQDSVLATDLEFVHEPEFLPYQAVFAAREADQDDPTWEILEEVYRSPAVTEAYEKENRGLGVISQASLDDLLDYQQRTEATLQTR